MIIQDLDEPSLVDSDSTKDRKDLVVSYLVGHLKTHNSYVFWFLFCELLNLVNIITQVKNPYHQNTLKIFVN